VKFSLRPRARIETSRYQPLPLKESSGIVHPKQRNGKRGQREKGSDLEISVFPFLVTTAQEEFTFPDLPQIHDPQLMRVNKGTMERDSARPQAAGITIIMRTER
jgi:hypothetical protein